MAGCLFLWVEVGTSQVAAPGRTDRAQTLREARSAEVMTLTAYERYELAMSQWGVDIYKVMVRYVRERLEELASTNTEDTP